MHSVLVVEDAEGPRNDLVDYLVLKDFKATGVGTVAAAWQALADALPAVIVLDVGLPDCHGFDFAREVRQRHGLACGIIMLTGLSSVDDKVEGLASGADIYLVKHASLREIEANIRGLLRRVGLETTRADIPPKAPDGDWRLDATTWHLSCPQGTTTQLTATEYACVAKLLGSRGTAVSRADLIAALDRPSMRYNERNLDGLISRLRRKVIQSAGQELPVSVIYGVGYIFRPLTGDEPQAS
ncbi:response regulator transcription factor [Nitrospirillum iridis]|uniref:DNA-binding response OmpR family regulator n=1 Tax=Nitrospirillum iridis TaxID=765888 RepID=A0A7X0AV70_9PROT|nr:response regulator transcription factor [Nitrospirillum iridis]MBB6250703.1 DNA-binding response OmpR family regulator [Nitrospirillum iridis]